MKKLTLHRVHRVTTFVQVKQRDKHLNGTKHMARVTGKGTRVTLITNDNKKIKFEIWAETPDENENDKWYQSTLNGSEFVDSDKCNFNGTCESREELIETILDLYNRDNLFILENYGSDMMKQVR